MVRSFSFGRIRPCSNADLELGEDVGAQALGLRLGGPHLGPVALVDRGAHDERLVAGRDLVAHERLGGGAIRGGARGAVRTGATARGQLVDHRHVEVAVVGQGERPRDRRRRHDQDVDVAPPLPFSAVRWCRPNRCCSSTTARTDRRTSRLLDERVRADHQVERPSADALHDRARGPCRSRARQQRVGIDGVARDPAALREQEAWSRRLGRGAARNGTAPIGSSSAVAERRCWPARTSVGAMIAA